MKTSELINLIVCRIKAGIKRPVYIQGAPGGGKTQLCGQVQEIMRTTSEYKDFGFMAIHGPLLMPEDYGFPVIQEGRTDVKFITSQSVFPLRGSNCAEHGLFLIDDMAQSDNATQKILRGLIQDRNIHGNYIKDGWTIVATGNRTTDRAGSNRLLSHMSNVLTRIDLELSIDDWTNWAFSKGIAPELIAFLRFKPGLLSNFDPQQEVNATPRAWAEGVNAALGVVDPAHEFAVFEGDVGKGPAAEFMGFLKIFRKLPSPDTIMLAPKTHAVPTEPSVLYALTGALSAKVSAANFGRIMEFICRMPTEFTVLFVRDAVRLCPAVQTTQDFIQWASGPGAKLLT